MIWAHLPQAAANRHAASVMCAPNTLKQQASRLKPPLASCLLSPGHVLFGCGATANLTEEAAGVPSYSRGRNAGEDGLCG